jgi:hypothetical protein
LDSWKFACLHLHIERYEPDSEDCTVTADFHDTDLPLKCILSAKGSAQVHLRALYPSWTGNIAEIVEAYFQKIGVKNECDKFDTINNLQGKARRLALEEDVKSRVLDLGLTSPLAVGIISKRGKPEAYDMTVEEETTPLGTVVEHSVYVPVSTPIFEARMLDKLQKEKLDRVEKSMLAYDDLIEMVDEHGFMKIAKPEADPKVTTKLRRDATVVSIATHNLLLQKKEAIIAALRTQLKRKEPDAPAVKQSVVVDLSSELEEANKHCGRLLTRIEELQAQVASKQAKIDLADSEQKAAVANAKCEVMTSMMSGGFSAGQTPIRGANTN